MSLKYNQGFPGGSDGKESVCNAIRLGKQLSHPKGPHGFTNAELVRLVIQQLPHHPDSGEVALWRGFPAPCSWGEHSSFCVPSFVSGQTHLYLGCSELTGWPRFS